MTTNTPTNNRYMTKQEFETFIFKHAPQRAKGYKPMRFLRWFTAFGHDLGTATKVWKAWNDMSLSQCAYLNACDELDRQLF